MLGATNQNGLKKSSARDAKKQSDCFAVVILRLDPCACRYIDRPLLVSGRKFHLRAYVLCVGSLTAYVFDEILVLCAPDKYDAALSQLGNHRSHLTNTCLQSTTGDLDGDDSNPGGAEALGLINLLSELPQVGTMLTLVLHLRECVINCTYPTWGDRIPHHQFICMTTFSIELEVLDSWFV